MHWVLLSQKIPLFRASRYRGWEPNSGPLEEWYVSLTMETSLSIPNVFLSSEFHKMGKRRLSLIHIILSFTLINSSYNLVISKYSQHKFTCITSISYKTRVSKHLLRSWHASGSGLRPFLGSLYCRPYTDWSLYLITIKIESIDWPSKHAGASHFLSLSLSLIRLQ